MHQYEEFSDKDLEECKEATSRMRRNELLIKKLFHLAVNKDIRVLDWLVEALVKTDQTFIIDHLRNQSSTIPGLLTNLISLSFILKTKLHCNR